MDQGNTGEKRDMTTPAGIPARIGKFAGIVCFIVLCISAILTAGCMESAQAGIATSSASPAADAAAALSSCTRTLPGSLDLDPIAGTWRSPGQANQFRITFGLDGTTQETFSNQPGVSFNGTWVEAGDNQYIVTRDTGVKSVWIYAPDANTITKKTASGITYSLYQGTNSAGSVSFAGNGTTVVPFTVTSPGLWVFTLDHTGGGNYIVWITDSAGCRVALLANAIGTGTVTDTEKLGAGKYYLDVTAGGPWTVAGMVSS
jgi:hypothetical protein